MKIVAVALVLIRTRAGDLDQDLAAEAERDEQVTNRAKCWCKELDASLDSRNRETQSELRALENRKTLTSLENERLRFEVSQHQADAQEHQQSIDSGSVVTSKEKAAYEEEKSQHEDFLKSIGGALDALPVGSAHEVRGALRGLNATFTKKLAETEAAYESRIDGLLGSKAEMLRLANEAAVMKQERLADGVVTVETASTLIGLYTARGEADSELSTVLRNLCSAVDVESASRMQQRQQVLIAISQANAEVAHAKANQASAKLVLLHRNSQLHRADKGGQTGTFAANFEDLLSRGNEIQSSMMHFLSTVATNTNHAQISHYPENVKTALATLVEQARNNTDSMAMLFDAVRSAGTKCSEADKQVVSKLSSKNA